MGWWWWWWGGGGVGGNGLSPAGLSSPKERHLKLQEPMRPTVAPSALVATRLFAWSMSE